jgi:hypothetical protein
MERENLELKQKIKELEATLMPGPLFPEPLEYNSTNTCVRKHSGKQQ